MPFKSEAQRRFLWAKHPEIAKRWSEEYGAKPVKKKKVKRQVKAMVDAFSMDRTVDSFAMAFDETKHPRGKKGTHEGGRFVSGLHSSVTPLMVQAAIMQGMNAHNKLIRESKELGKVHLTDYNGNKYELHVWHTPDDELHYLLSSRNIPHSLSNMFRGELPKKPLKTPKDTMAAIAATKSYAKETRIDLASKARVPTEPIGRTPKSLAQHPMYSHSDYVHLRDKGYSNNEIKAFWDRDHAAGKVPVEHKTPPDVVGLVSGARKPRVPTEPIGRRRAKGTELSMRPLILSMSAGDAECLSTDDPLTFWKEIAHAGTFWKGSQRIDITPRHLSHWEKTHRAMSKAGLKVPVPVEHTKDPERKRGDVLAMAHRPNSRGIPALYAKIKFRDADAAKMIGSGVSIFVPKDATSGYGHRFVSPVEHVAITDYPVIPDLEPFTQTLALSLVSGDMTMAFDESKHPRGKKGTHEGGKFVPAKTYNKAAGDAYHASDIARERPTAGMHYRAHKAHLHAAKLATEKGRHDEAGDHRTSATHHYREAQAKIIERDRAAAAKGDLSHLSDDQLSGRFNKVLDKIHKAFRGGGMFGVDEPTLHAVHPELHAEYMDLRKEGRKRYQANPDKYKKQEGTSMSFNPNESPLVMDAASRPGALQGISLSFPPNGAAKATDSGKDNSGGDKPTDKATPGPNQQSGQQQPPATATQKLSLRDLATQLGIDQSITDEQQLLTMLSNVIMQLKARAQAPMPPQYPMGQQPQVQRPPMPPSPMAGQPPMMHPQGQFGPPAIHTGRPPVAMSRKQFRRAVANSDAVAEVGLSLGDIPPEIVMALSKKQMKKVLKTIKKGKKGGGGVSGDKEYVQKLNDKSHFGTDEDCEGGDYDDTYKDENNDAFENGEDNDDDGDGTFNGKGSPGKLSHVDSMALSGAVLDAVKTSRTTIIDSKFKEGKLTGAGRTLALQRFVAGQGVALSHQYDDGFDFFIQQLDANGRVVPGGKTGIQAAGAVALSNGELSESNPLIADADRRAAGKNNL